MYHRIVDPESVGYAVQPGMYVRPETFRKHLEFLGRRRKIYPLDELVTSLAEGRSLPQNAAAITFDDGWSDNFSHAFPLMKEFGLPGTVFLATSFIGTNRAFWTDVVSQFIEHLRSNRAALSEERFFTRFRQILGDGPFSGWQSLILRAIDTPREMLLDRMVGFLSRLPRERRDSILSLLRETAPVQGERQFLDWNEVSEMSRGGMTFGSHTHTHQLLTELEPERVREEIRSAASELRSHQIESSQVFCYPAGAWSDAAQQVLSEEGIQYALGVERGHRFDTVPALIGRVAIHEDVTSSTAMFASRLVLR